MRWYRCPRETQHRMPEAFSLENALMRPDTLLYFVPGLLFLPKFVFQLGVSFCLLSLYVFGAVSMDPNVFNN
jgi:hypothetical protein